MNLHIRYMILRDLPEVLAIERDSFQWPWQESEFVGRLRSRWAISRVAEVDMKVVGYLVYELTPKCIDIISIAVHRDFRRLQVASALIDKAREKARDGCHDRLTTVVTESNVGAQLFFRSQGMRCVRQEHDYFAETPEDAYFFSARICQTVRS